MPGKSEGYKQGGLRKKYKVERTDGKPIEPGAEFFVLRPDSDPYARVALDFYARSVKEDNPELSAQILDGLDRLEQGGRFYQAAA